MNKLNSYLFDFMVKKGISILSAIVMIATMFHFSVATHYCGGHIAASKVSLTGELANCGMEGSQKQVPPPGIYFSKHCCEDVVFSYSTDNNYIPSFFNIPDSDQYNYKVSVLPSQHAAILSIVSKSQYSDKSPPGAMRSTNVELSDICVFRI